MAIVLTQTDAASDHTFTTSMCDGGTVNSARSSKKATSGGTAGTTPVTVTQDGVIQRRTSVYFESAASEPNSASWESGNWTVRIEVTTANMNLNGLQGSICRIDSAGANIASVYGASTFFTVGADGVATTGVKSATVAGDAQTAAASDKMLITFAPSNSTTMTQSWAYTPSQNIDTPVTQGGGGGGGTATRSTATLPMLGVQ